MPKYGMPHEKRLIEFSEQEVRAALSMFIESTDELGGGQQDDAQISFGEGLTATVQLDGKPNIDVNKAKLAAALMLYCKTVGIPLPRSAKKSLQRKSDTFVLMIQL